MGILPCGDLEMKEATVPDPLAVPVREGRAALSLRLFLTATGEPVVMAFSSPASLTRVLGSEQRWILLSESALHEMVDELTKRCIVVDRDVVRSTKTTPAAR